MRAGRQWAGTTDMYMGLCGQRGLRADVSAFTRVTVHVRWCKENCCIIGQAMHSFCFSVRDRVHLVSSFCLQNHPPGMDLGYLRNVFPLSCPMILLPYSDRVFYCRV